MVGLTSRLRSAVASCGLMVANLTLVYQNLHTHQFSLHILHRLALLNGRHRLRLLRRYTPVRKVLAERKVQWQCLDGNKSTGTRLFPHDQSSQEIYSMRNNVPKSIPKYTAQRNISRATQNGSQDFLMWLLLP